MITVCNIIAGQGRPRASQLSHRPAAAWLLVAARPLAAWLLIAAPQLGTWLLDGSRLVRCRDVRVKQGG